MALAAPAVAILIAAALWGLRYSWAELRCSQAAAAAAEAAGRGASLAAVSALARADAPPGADVNISRLNRIVTVTVHLGFPRCPGPLAVLPPLDITVAARAFR